MFGSGKVWQIICDYTYSVYYPLPNFFAVVLHSFAHACLYIYTVCLDNLVSLYGVIVLVLLSYIYYCLLIIFHDIRRYYICQLVLTRKH